MDTFMTVAMDTNMPPRAPLDMPEQDFQSAPKKAAAEAQRDVPIWRVAVFVPALVLTGLMVWGLHRLFSASGMTSLEYVLLGLIGATFVWVTLSVSTVAVGVAGRREHSETEDIGEKLDVALLVPIYNEVAADVFGNASAMLDDLNHRQRRHRYTLFMLSDT